MSYHSSLVMAPCELPALGYHEIIDKKVSIFPKEQDGNLYLGVELEVDMSTDIENLVEKIHRRNSNVFFHSDGSLSSNGIEIVSHPFTLDGHRELGWEEIIKICRSFNAKSHDAGNCGLHIHFNKSFLGSNREYMLNIIKLIWVFRRFRDELIRFSRRENKFLNTLNKLDVNDDEFKDVDNDEVAEEFRKQRGVRFAVNVTTKGNNTVEIRLWRGTLNLKTFYATLEFTDHLIRLIKELPPIILQHMSWYTLCASVMYMKGTEYLEGYMRRRGLLNYTNGSEEAQLKFPFTKF